MGHKTKILITNYIDFLSKMPLDHYEYSTWVPNCIECLQFAFDNEQLLEEKPELYHDTLSTLSLLHALLIEGKEWAYIELREKFKTRYSNEEVGKSLKLFAERLNKENTTKIKCSLKPLASKVDDIQNIDGSYKSLYQILNDLAEMF